MLARLFVIFGGLFVLVLCAALVVPYFVDWTGYRAQFEREASAILGRKVTVQGDATARLLPFPSVTFSNVAVAGGPNGRPAMTVETFSMDAELAPFLRGEVLIFDMRLVHPKATIDIANDGTVDWAMRPSSPFDLNQISIEKLTVTEGQIELRHAAGGRSHIFSEINSTISAKSLAGPWRMDGTLRLDGLRTTIAASTGKAEGNGQMRLRLKADPDAYPLVIETDGNAGIVNGAAVYSGQFKISGADKNSAQLRGTDGETVKVSAGKPDPGFRLNGKFSLDHQKLGVDEFRFETGPLDNPYTADGKASVDLGQKPSFAIEANGAQVQFDEAVGGQAGTGLTLDQRIAGLEQALLDLPKPTIPGTVEVKLPAVVAGDTTVRDVHLSAEPVESGWSIKSLAATLPGRTTLEADGMLALNVQGHFGFTGSLLLAVAQPSGFAAWLSRDVDEAIRRLPAAGFKAKVDLSENHQSFSDLELILGKAKFSGRIDSSQPDDAKPSVLMRLEGGELDVDGLAAFASIFVSDKGANRFANSDLDFQIKAGPVSAGGLTADTVDTALRLRDGLLEVDRLSLGGLAGASISATGRIKDFPASPTGKLDASVVAVDLKPLIDVAAQHYPDNAVLKGLASRAAAYPDLFQDARVDLVASAADNGDGTTGLAVSGQGKAGGTAFSASLSGKGAPDKLLEAPVTLTFNAKNPDATALLALYGLPALPLGMLGEATTDIQAKGTFGGGLGTTFSLAGNDFKAGFEGTVADTPQGPTAKGKINLDAADIEPWLMTTGIGLPGMGAGMSTSLSAQGDYGNGLLVLDNVSGAINEAAVSGDVNIDVKDGLPHLAGALALDELDLDPMAVALFGDSAFLADKNGADKNAADKSAKGGVWPAAPFSQKSSLPFTADLDLTTAALAAGPLATAYDASFSLKLDQEGIRVSDLKAKLLGGALTGLFELKNTDGTGLFTGQMKLAGADLANVLPDAGIGGVGDFSTTLSTSGKSVDAMIAALSGSGTAALKGLQVAGVNPDAFSAFLAKADAIGRDIDAAKTAGFAPGIAADGNFPAKDADIAFTIAGGMLRAPPISLENPAATLSADVTADLNTSTVSAKGAITYRPGDEALVGSEPVVNFTAEGPFGAVKRQFDSEPLAQFLTQRALEKEQQRVEAMQAALLEKQRLRREVRYYAALQDARDKAAEELRQQEEAARLKAEADAKAKAEADAQAQAEAEAKAKADAEAKAKADAEAKAKADADAKAKADADAKAAAEQQAADEAAKAQADEEQRQKAEEAKRIASQEKARLEAERKAAEPKVERAPLPEASDNPPAKPKANPFTIDNLLKSLQ
ncbi:hypothetical protein MesoLj113a_37500 [Mesorhizobium sp. 113-1-2]|uniref:AsmA family protein n=1 Tax=Mesorhizobium sp. 113-1-2 TaxID=2744515 RepID=UPI0008198EED|nr:AsmA family protein [Mesorhizobium sp. 113-1-2]BAV46158.1 membrane protein involved in colicin uptake [Mesorhizobium loti]BCG72592.1 hypothetical protein MesoLj113a_37500 [Mesorhizobium sp. 113-1-2]